MTHIFISEAWRPLMPLVQAIYVVHITKIKVKACDLLIQLLQLYKGKRIWHCDRLDPRVDMVRKIMSLVEKWCFYYSNPMTLFHRELESLSGRLLMFVDYDITVMDLMMTRCKTDLRGWASKYACMLSKAETETVILKGQG